MRDVPSSGGAATAGTRLHDFIRRGRSFSGRERNCCFLNTGRAARRFADVSTVSGFDFADDARAIARVDWDHDGDLDFWVANRSGPQVRFLRNDVPRAGRSISLALVGTRSNRDAIGARVEMVFANEAHPKLVRSLRAGDGFLAQSTKWLHFGLGEATEIERVTVRWPNGEEEDFRDVRAGGRFRLVEGRGVAEASPKRQPGVRLVETPPREFTSREPRRVVSRARLPVPILEYDDFDGEPRSVFRAADEDATGATEPRAMLLVLWASWCPPCILELREIAERAGDLRAAGLDVVALSVDGLAEKPGRSPAELSDIIAQTEFPFAAGLARERTLERLERVHDRLFDLRRRFPVPVSFLIDGRGELLTIYRGRLGVDALLHDVERAKTRTLRASALPFSGRWLREPGRLSPFTLVWELLAGGDAHAGIRYFAKHHDLLRAHVRFPQLAVLAGNARLSRGDVRAAMALYREAIARDAEYVDAQNNLAWVLATHAEDGVRDGAEAVRLAQSALQKSEGRLTSVWNTLAAALAEAGDFPRAIEVAERALELARDREQGELAETIERRLALYRNHLPYRSR